MHELNPALFTEYMQLWLLLDDTPFNANGPGEDDIIWTRSASGKYSQPNMQFDGSTESSFPADIWQVWAPSKCKFSIWLMLQGRIWTADRGRMNTSALYVVGIWKRCLTPSSNARCIWSEISSWQGCRGCHHDAGGLMRCCPSGSVSSLGLELNKNLWREPNARIF
jgi:hypothetical protein